MKKRKFDIGECSHAIKQRSIEGVVDDLVLESKHKIFLSHSGVQKEFVEHLCKALEDCFHYPFFDRRPASLPKGKEFSGLIVKAAQQCQLLVVVVSEEYFMSKWPMIELNAFVQATKVLKLNMNASILPLFYGLSVNDLKDEQRRQRWLEKWETFVKDDPVEGRIKVEDWSFAVDELTKFNGLSYNRELKGIVAYEEEIVSHICKSVPPDIKSYDLHVQGNMHEVLFDKMKQIGLSQTYKVKVVGIYGVGGIGKTTTCKMLCNELSSNYKGRVCHIEVPCFNSEEFLQSVKINLQSVLIKLTRQSAKFVHQLSEGECEDVLYKKLHKHRTFLAIDNVWDNYYSIKQAKVFLNTPFHNDSLVVVTSRSQSTLALLGIDGDACFEMPELEEADARSLFLSYAAPREEFTTREDMDSIEWCVKKCYFCKGGGRGYHYHPLALEALGRQLCGFEEKLSKWVHRLSRVWKSGFFSGEKVVFDVLRSSYDLLEPSEQTLFMDVSVFCLDSLKDSLGYGKHLKEQLCVLYKKDEFEIQSQLDSLKRKGLLQDANLISGRITMHDLYREFVTLEAVGKLGAALDMWDRKWVLVNVDDGDLSELEVTPKGGCWHKLSRLSIQQEDQSFKEHLEPHYCSSTNSITSLERIKWQYFSNVLVLELRDLKLIFGSLNLQGMTCLRILQLYNPLGLKRLEGLESLKHLTCAELGDLLSNDYHTETHVVGQFPASLKYLLIDGDYVLSGSNAFAHCNNLIKLDLVSLKVGALLDLSNCLSLESTAILRIADLQTLSRLPARGSSRLHPIEIEYDDENPIPMLEIHIPRGSSRLHTFQIECNNDDFEEDAEIPTRLEIHIPKLDQLVGLVRLEVNICSWKMPCLISLTKLEVLEIGFESELAELDVQCIPHQLHKLYCHGEFLREAPCLSLLKQLQVLDFRGNKSLTHIFGLGDLPALQSLVLQDCASVKQLPNLSKSTSLEVLNLCGCDKLELHEEDFAMLATLPLLHPVPFSTDDEKFRIRLDIVGRKVLQYLGPLYYGPSSWLVWKEGELQELELRLPPIKIGNCGI